MLEPKVGEIWVSSSDTDHKVLFAEGNIVVTIKDKIDPTVNTFRYAWRRDGTTWTVINSSCKITLNHKKKNKIVRWVGFYWGGGNSNPYITYSGYEYEPTQKHNFVHLQKVEFEVDQ